MRRSRDLSGERTAWLLGLGAFAWMEIQRRLENLNHENERILKAQQGSVSADTYRANEEQRKSEQTKLEDWQHLVNADRQKAVTREEFQGDARVARQRGISMTQGLLGLAVLAVTTVLAITNWINAHDKVVVTPTTVTVTTTVSKP